MHFRELFDFFWQRTTSFFNRLTPQSKPVKAIAAERPTAGKEPQAGKDRKGDPTLLGDRREVSFRTAQEYLGLSRRQIERLVAKETLQRVGGGHSKMITTESLRRYVPPVR